MATTYYSSGYQNSLPSGVNSQQGVMDWQHQLRGMGYLSGAGAVDGIWGPNTQAAYQQYTQQYGGGQASQAGLPPQPTMAGGAQGGVNGGAGAAGQNGGFFGSQYIGATQPYLGGYNPGGSGSGSGSMSMSYTPPSFAPVSLERLNYTPRTDESIRGEVEGLVNPSYDREALRLQQGYEEQTRALSQADSKLDNVQEDALQQLERSAESNRVAVQADAIRRGMGYSTTTIDALANVAMSKTEAEGKILRDISTERANIQSQITQAARQLSDKQESLSQAQQNEIKGYIEKLKEYDRQMALDTQKFNADQSYREAMIMQEQQMASMQMQAEYAKMQQQNQLAQMQFEYQAFRDQQNWGMDSQQMQWAQEQAMWERDFKERQFAAELAASSGRSSGGGGSGGGGAYNPFGIGQQPAAASRVSSATSAYPLYNSYNGYQDADPSFNYQGFGTYTPPTLPPAVKPKTSGGVTNALAYTMAY